MPLNLLKKYNSLLEIDSFNDSQRYFSLKAVFERDFIKSTNSYKSRNIIPTPKDGQTTMEVLFSHLTTKTDNYNPSSRCFDRDRSVRLHWIKYHFQNPICCEIEVFSVKDKEGVRTYFYNPKEQYVIILEPRKDNLYYLLTAYYIKGADKIKIENKKKRKLSEIH